MSFNIRLETPLDVAVIHDLTEEAFKNAPHADYTEQFIIDELRSAGALHISLVAEVGGKVVGHVAISPVSISDGSMGWFGLGPIAVSPECQGQGIGSRLTQRALHLLRQESASGCVVLGDPGYYYRFGFKPEASLVLAGVPPEYFQAVSFSGSIPYGEVTYDEAFRKPSFG